ncbi:MAG: DUF1080 domain-containing protein [Bacteroidia bacterium]
MRFILFFTIFLSQQLFAQSDDSWKPLFNGKNLKGWSMPGTAEAKLENDEVVVKNLPGNNSGWILTDAEYDNFEIEGEFFLPPSARGGLFFRYNTSAGGDPSSTAYEINLSNNPDQASPTGTIDGLARAIWVPSINTQWNKFRVSAEGDYLRVWINDTQVSQTHDRRSIKGKIGLRAYGNEGTVKWKNLRIRVLPAMANAGPLIEDYLRNTGRGTTTSLFDGSSLTGWKIVGDARWLVVDGAILGDTGPKGQGWLVTEKAFSNFYMSYKFKLEDGHNSGVFIRWDTTATEITLQNSLETNIYDPGGYMWGFPTGSIVSHSRSFPGITDSDDWNQVEIFAFGDHICLYLNGQKTTDFHVPATFDRPGYICLQAGRQAARPDQGPSQVRFKDLMIKDLSGIPFVGY